MYLHAKFWRDISIHGWDKTTSGFGKFGRSPYWNFISGFDFDLCMIIGIPFCICLPNFVVIGRSVAESRRHIDFSRWRPQSRKCTSRFTFSNGICLITWKCICMKNFDKISQSTAEINLLPILEMDSRHFGIFSDFDFDIRIVSACHFASACQIS